jgi:hypothetical protein
MAANQISRLSLKDKIENRQFNIINWAETTRHKSVALPKLGEYKDYPFPKNNKD